jgi:hypothetical protein
MLLLTYFVGLGATYNGILDTGIRSQTMQIFAVVIGVWLFIRWRGGWRWRPTPLDTAILLWIAAFALSLLANADEWRRIAIGLWFMGGYIVLWYLLSDTLANRAFTRQMLVNALLFVGAILMLFAWAQIIVWMQTQFPAMQAGGAPFSLPRPVSVLGNANTLAAALVLIIPLSLVNAVQNRGLPRIVMSLYTLSALLLLFATFSRAGWLGAAAGIGAVILWLLADRGRLNVTAWRAAWAGWSGGRKAVTVGLGLLVVIIVIGAAVFFVSSFSLGGRTLDLRTFIYETAWQLFREQPLFGQGLFTFGGGLARLNPTPPTEPHSHAHSIPLNVAAELGILGLIALIVTVILIVRAARRNAETVHGAERFALIAAGGACISFTVHHLLDLPAMNPAIMIMGLFALVAFAAPLALAKDAPNLITHRIRGAVVIVGSIGLIIVGVWSAAQYQRYWDAVYYAIDTGDYAGGAARLDPVIAVDPSLPLYYQQRGMLYGLAAAAGDTTLLPAAITSFERFTQLAPYSANGWYNLAALYAQAGRYEDAAEALQQLAILSPPLYETLLNATADQISFDPETIFDAEDQFMPNINSIQWLSYAIPRQWLPQTQLALPDEVRALINSASTR